jgi:transcriptional regulator with XRE-family HTH domain
MAVKRFGVVLKDLRARRGLSQQTLADRVGVSDAYIAMLETGTRRNPSLILLQRLARALGVPVTRLLE